MTGRFELTAVDQTSVAMASLALLQPQSGQILLFEDVVAFLRSFDLHFSDLVNCKS